MCVHHVQVCGGGGGDQVARRLHAFSHSLISFGYHVIHIVGLDELETSVLKATYDDEDPPKTKHVTSTFSLLHVAEILMLMPMIWWRVIICVCVSVSVCQFD